MQLYSIDVRGKDNDADSGRGKQRGLKSPFGRRGAICAHFGWTWEYLHNGIAWATVQRMMADAPSFDYEEPEAKTEDDHVKLSNENSAAIGNYINNLM